MNATDERQRPDIVAHLEHAHPGPRTYVQVAIALAILTSLEIELTYLPSQLERFFDVTNFQTWTIIPPLIVLAVFKFALVVMFFMHLRFDNKLYTFMFVGGLALAMTVFIAVLTIQRVFFA